MPAGTQFPNHHPINSQETYHENYNQCGVNQGLGSFQINFLKRSSEENPFSGKLIDLGYGYNPETNRFYVVHEQESMEVMQKAMAENQDAVEGVGVDQSTIQIITLDG